MDTASRQVRLRFCAIFAPGLEQRASNDTDATTLRTNGFDIRPFVQKIDIFEGVFDNTISGSITLLETIGLPEYLPIVGVESLGLVFEIDSVTGGKPKQFSRLFRINGLTHQSFPRNEVRVYTLHFTTPEFLTSLSSRISRAFRDMTAADAVRNILTQDLQIDAARILTNEPTFGTVDATIPNYTPLMAINYFTMLSQTMNKRNSNFMFFETLDGFHFASLSTLMQQDVPPNRIFRVDNAVASNANNSPARQLNSVLRMHQDQGFDLLRDISSGMLASRMVHFDFLARKLDPGVSSRYTKTFDETGHLGAFPVYPKNFDQTVGDTVRIFTVPSNAWSTKSAYIDSIEKPVAQLLHESIVLRNRQLKEIMHMQTLLDLAGQPDLRAGDVVDVRYPSSRLLQGDPDSTDSVAVQPTPFYSGKHLVTSVHHIIQVNSDSSMEYRMNVAVNRDSFDAALMGAAK